MKNFTVLTIAAATFLTSATTFASDAKCTIAAFEATPEVAVALEQSGYELYTEGKLSLSLMVDSDYITGIRSYVANIYGMMAINGKMESVQLASKSRLVIFAGSAEEAFESLAKKLPTCEELIAEYPGLETR